MTYKFELFLVIQKRAHKYKIIKLSLPLILYIVLCIYDYFFNDLFILDSSFSTLN